MSRPKADSLKTYHFRDDSDPCVPADYWFQQPPEGLTLFVVFYTQAWWMLLCFTCALTMRPLPCTT